MGYMAKGAKFNIFTDTNLLMSSITYQANVFYVFSMSTKNPQQLCQISTVTKTILSLWKLWLLSSVSQFPDFPDLPRLDWIEQCFMSPPTQYRLYGRRLFCTDLGNSGKKPTICDSTALVSLSLLSVVRSLSSLRSARRLFSLDSISSVAGCFLETMRWAMLVTASIRGSWATISDSSAWFNITIGSQHAFYCNWVDLSYTYLFFFYQIVRSFSCLL